MNKLENITLDNGLKIYLYEDKRRHSTFFQFITLFGGIHKDFVLDNEEFHFQDGIAHALEHYIVECNEAGNFIKELGKRQMNTNASTYFNMTRFYFEAVDEVETGVEMMLNGIYNVNFTKEKLDKLKEPIYQEIRAHMDNKFYHLNIKSFDNLFSDIKFRNIAGSVDDVEKITVDDIRTCYEAFYQPENQFIVIAGNFNKDEILNQIKDFYKKNNIKIRNVELIKNKEKNEVLKKEDILYFSTPSDYVNISFKININHFSPEEKLDFDFYLGCFYNDFFGNTSKLHKELIDEKIITRGISCGDYMIDDFLIINIGAYTKDVDYFKKKVFETIDKADSFSEEKFSLSKKSSIIRLIMRDENIIQMIMPFVDNVVNFKYPYLDSVKNIEKTSYEEYIKCIKELDFSNYSVVVIKDK